MKESLGKWISIIHRQFQIYLNRKLKPYGINSSEYIYLLNLAREEGVNQKQLSDMLFIDDALTTRAMKSLETKGFLIREKSKRDQRAYEIRLTEKGVEIQPVILKILNQWTGIISQNISESEYDYFLNKLKTLSNNALKETKGLHDE